MKKLLLYTLLALLAGAGCKKDRTEPVRATKIELSDTALTLTVGQADLISARIFPDNAENRTVAWKSADERIATVDRNGRIVAVAVGSTRIAATCDGITAFCQVTVTPVNAQSITLDRIKITLDVGQTRTLQATVKPENTTDKTVAWKSADERIATVDSNGTVTAVAVGSVEVTASCGKAKAVCTVTVEEPDEDITRYFDPEFAAVLQEKGYISNASYILKSEVKKHKSLNLEKGNLTSLAGIELFDSLQRLICADQRLLSLDVSKNAALTFLLCENNQLTALNVSTSLKALYCNNNQLTALDVSNTALTSLECENNQLTALDVSKNTALIHLECGNNQLTALDVSKNTALTHLECGNNQLTALDVSKNTALTSLECNNNQLTALDVSKNTALTHLECNNNRLTVLDVSQNTALAHLECGNNQLTALDVSKNTALDFLECNNNQLTTLDVSKNTALTWLKCGNNQLTVLDVSQNTALFFLYCENNRLTSLDVSKINLNNASPNYRLLNCYMPTLQTLYLKTGWLIDGINMNSYDYTCIHPNTEIRYKD